MRDLYTINSDRGVQNPENLADVIYEWSLGSLDADVGRGVARGLGSEGADGARHEDLEVVLLRQLHHVVQPWN